MNGFKYKKAVQLLAYFAKLEGGRISRLKSLKLTWLADRLHLRQYYRTITGDTYFAMPLGPVAINSTALLGTALGLSQMEENYRCTYLNDFSENLFSWDRENELNMRVFSDTDIQCADKIYEAYGQMNEFELSNHSYTFPEWKKYESRLKSSMHPSRFLIDQIDFVLNIDDGHGLMFDDESDLEDVKSLYLDNKEANALIEAVVYS